MIKNYKCTECEGWFKEKEIHHISYSASRDMSYLCVYIVCKNCQKKRTPKEKRK